MPEVSVEVAGRIYRVGCGEGEEGHLIKLAERIDNEATRLTRTMGNMTEGRLMLLSALMLADKLNDEESGGANSGALDDLKVKLAESQATALEHEAKTADAEARAIEADVKLSEALEQAGSGDQQIAEMADRVKAAESKLAEALEEATKAEARATDAESFLEEARVHIEKADARVAEAELEVGKAAERATHAEKLAQTPAQPTDMFNPEREEEIAQSLDALAERIEALAGRVEMPA